MKAFSYTLISMLVMTSTISFAEVTANISLANDSAQEQTKAEQIKRIIDIHNLEKWWFTDNILVDEKARTPFSHPILTMNAKGRLPDDAVLSTLLHEQIHWFEEEKKHEVAAVIARLRSIYPDVPVGYPDGARDEFSTYLHLAVCLMELDALTEVLDKARAETIIAKNGKYFYRWIYKTVLKDQEALRALLIKENLYIH